MWVFLHLECILNTVLQITIHLCGEEAAFVLLCVSLAAEGMLVVQAKWVKCNLLRWNAF